MTAVPANRVVEPEHANLNRIFLKFVAKHLYSTRQVDVKQNVMSVMFSPFLWNYCQDKAILSGSFSRDRINTSFLFFCVLS